MNSAALLLLAFESLALAGVVLALYRLRGRTGLTPLYVMLGVFQPVQVGLSSAIYVDLWPGVPVSPGTLMFASTLLAMLLVYLREDAIEARKVIYGVLGANLAITLILGVAAVQLGTPGTANLLGVDPAFLAQAARVTAVGTVILVADVVFLILLHSALRRPLARLPAVRAWATLTGVLVFDAVAFTTGAFYERPDYPSLLAAGMLSKAVVGTFFSLCLLAYLRWVEPAGVPGAPSDHPLRDVFYAWSYRDRFEHQARRHAEEREEVFERITDAFVALDRDWRYTYVNSKAAQALGRRAEDLVGRHIWTEFPEGEAERFADAYRQAMATQEAVYLEEYYPPFDRWFENRIYPSPEGLTIYFHDVTERVRQRQELMRRALRDDLTGLPNRRTMRESLDALLEGRPATEPLGVLMLNVDRLHHINDTLGYAAGDEVLVEVARRLEDWAGATGWRVGCFGGDEFVLANAVREPAVELDTVAHQAMQVLARPYAVAGQTVYLTWSAGASWFPDAGHDAATLLEQADLALNVAKQRGRNKVCLFSRERSAEVRHRLAITNRMRHALEHDAFRLHYQPLVDASTGRIVAAEALMRWNDPDLGDVEPARFIPIAEDTGAIVRMGEWALRTAIAELAAWQAAGASPVPLAVNVSTVQFQRPEFVQEIEAGLQATGVPPGLLKLEITESVFLEDTPAAVRLLHQLKRLGVRVSLDDFGTGYSNLALLRELPIDEIKIDRSFVRDISADSYAATLCRAIVAMSHDLRFAVVAEGVETAAEAYFLRHAGCHALQGFLFSPAVAAVEFGAMLASGARWEADGRRVDSDAA